MPDDQGPVSAVPRVRYGGEAGRRELQQSALRDRHDKSGAAAVFPSKLGAAVQLAKLTGWNEVEKVSVEAGDTLSAFLRQIVTR
jgi:hypothetical protein